MLKSSLEGEKGALAALVEIPDIAKIWKCTVSYQIRVISNVTIWELMAF